MVGVRSYVTYLAWVRYVTHVEITFCSTKSCVGLIHPTTPASSIFGARLQTMSMSISGLFVSVCVPSFCGVSRTVGTSWPSSFYQSYSQLDVCFLRKVASKERCNLYICSCESSGSKIPLPGGKESYFFSRRCRIWELAGLDCSFYDVFKSSNLAETQSTQQFLPFYCSCWPDFLLCAHLNYYSH